MNSNITFEWKKPLAFSPLFVQKFIDLTELFKRRLVAYVVTDAGYNAAQITSAADADALYEADRKSSLYWLASALHQIEQTAWSLRLKDDTSINTIDTPGMLSLPNVGRQQIMYARYGNRSSACELFVRFSNHMFVAGIEVGLAGPYELIQQFRSELETLFSAYTQPWWPIRDGRFLLWPAALAIVLLNSFSAMSILNGKSQPNNEFLARFVFGVALPLGSVLLFLGVPLTLFLTRCWNWVFPKVDFIFGGGVNSSEIRRNVRRALWVVPIIMLLFPVVTNLLSDKIK